MRYFILLFCLLLTACDNTQPSIYPEVPVNIVLDLNNLPYQRLQFDGGYVYLNGGIRGIILYRKNAGTYYAFDRACSFRPTNSCEQVEAHSTNLYLEDKCCQSKFDWEGVPTSGKASQPLLRYRVGLSGSLLYINN